MDAAEPAKPPSPGAAVATAVLAVLAAALLISIPMSLSPEAQSPAAVQTAGVPAGPPGPPAPPTPGLITFEPGGAADLLRVMDAAWSRQASPGKVPNVAPASLPPDLERLDVGTRKRAFFRGVLPYVLEINRTVRRDRAALLAVAGKVAAGGTPDEAELAQVSDLGRRYRLGEEARALLRGNPARFLDRLLRRVDVVPPALALSQAALESGWGTSRFALEGNNLFGQWVFSAEKGIAPLRRPEGADYAAARFDDLRQAVAAYVKNLNTLWAYEDFRSLRADLRDRGLPLDSMALAGGLLHYSERRDEYVDDVRRVIRGNRLTRFDGARLMTLDAAWLDSVAGEGGRLSALERGNASFSPDA